MIIGNKTLTTRYILPFIFDSSELFQEKYKFVNAYIEDINRPFLDNHVLLVFEYNSEINDELESKIKQNNWFCAKYDLFIDGIFYIEYVFIIPHYFKKIINTIKDGYFNSIDENSKIRIISFWNNIDFSYLKDLLNNSTDLTKIKSLIDRNEIITEEDPPFENTDVLSVFNLHNS